MPTLNTLAKLYLFLIILNIFVAVIQFTNKQIWSINAFFAAYFLFFFGKELESLEYAELEESE